MMISILPDIKKLKTLAQSIATLDLLLSPEWESRYYSFQSNWDENLDLFSMRNGSGDEFLIIFVPAGAVIKGFDHESPLTPYNFDPPRLYAGLLDDLPAVFAPLLEEPAFEFEATTFCLWNIGQSWQHGLLSEERDGSEHLLPILDGNPVTYQKWAEEYYERSVDLETITEIYQYQPLTLKMAQRLNAKVNLQDVLDELAEIDYPSDLNQ